MFLPPPVPNRVNSKATIRDLLAIMNVVNIMAAQGNAKMDVTFIMLE